MLVEMAGGRLRRTVAALSGSSALPCGAIGWKRGKYSRVSTGELLSDLWAEAPDAEPRLSDMAYCTLGSTKDCQAVSGVFMGVQDSYDAARSLRNRVRDKVAAVARVSDPRTCSNVSGMRSMVGEDHVAEQRTGILAADHIHLSACLRQVQEESDIF